MARVPRRLMKDPANAGLSAEEEHLLGCVDGSLSEEELSFVTGKAPDDIASMLDRLVEYGLVRFGADASAADEAEIVDPETADGIELSPEARQRIDEVFALVGVVDHYRLLDIPRDATKDEIKKAYYRLAPKFHPDKHYGKELGEYKGKIEKIFAALTKAHDTLRYSKRKTSYDASLPPLKPGDRIKRRRPEVAPAPRASSPGVPAARQSRPGVPPMRPRQPSSVGRSSDPGRASVEGGRASGVPPMRARSHSRPTMPSGPSVPARSSELPRESVPPEPGRSSVNPRGGVRPRTSSRPRSRPVSEAEREALRRKLGRRGAGPARRPRPIAEVRQVQRDVEEIDRPERIRPSAAEVLRSRYDQVRDSAKRQRLATYLETARVAMEAGDYRAASAAYEQALRLSPEDEDIKQKARSASEMALSTSPSRGRGRSGQDG